MVVVAVVSITAGVCEILTDIDPALKGYFRTKSEALKACGFAAG